MEPRWWGLWKTGLLDPPPWAFYLRCHGVLSTFPPSSLHLFSFFFFLAVLHCMQGPSAPTKDGTHTPCIRSGSPDHWTTWVVPICIHFYVCSSVHLYPFLDSCNYHYNQASPQKNSPPSLGLPVCALIPSLSTGNQCSLCEC